MGSVLANQRDWQSAERELQRAIQLNPRDPVAHYFYGFSVLGPMGRLDEGIVELKKSLQIDPLALIVNSNLGRLYFWQRQYDQALQQYRRTLESDPGFAHAHGLLIELYEQQGMYEKAIEESRLITIPTLGRPGVSRKTTDILRRGYLTGGAKGYWEARLDLAKATSIKEWVSPSSMALIYARLGQMDLAFEWLVKGIDQFDQPTSWMNPNPAFDLMRRDPRWASLVRKMGLEPIPVPKSQ